MREVFAAAPLKSEIDTAIEFRDALAWSVARSHVTRSGLLRLIGTPPYRRITIRNINTVRKLHELLAAHRDIEAYTK